MARLSDIIENFIKTMLEKSENDFLEIQRNELANLFNCAPSQINYVLETRFTIDKGYYIESKRGGGGFIKITKIRINDNDYLKDAIWNNIGEEITQQQAEGYIEFFKDRGYLTEREATILKIALNDKVINAPPDLKDKIRANILKTVLISII
ncbi:MULTISPECIES: CtsR family transcriptional regulator [Caloramator]|uniref:Transcriptional regulator CtsR n=1 Tax=Caloramator australicus RC3 TaxID=857293 RepID=G0V3Y2_9CLOT|nr:MULTISPECIES: CtsR family transcriptional regulator [Caloramator]MDO6354656.1 CtsR family transcriptional regulator [Caloramator sp. CAR-1]CCC57822.1 Transcriptional regulator CtsR [Caloramator australicus RC3]